MGLNVMPSMSARSLFDLLYNWPQNSELLLNNSLLEPIYFFNKKQIIFAKPAYSSNIAIFLKTRSWGYKIFLKLN